VSQVNPTGIAGYYDFNNIGSTVGNKGAGGRHVHKLPTCRSAGQPHSPPRFLIRSRSPEVTEQCKSMTECHS
jgi:hypothetical protein